MKKLKITLVKSRFGRVASVQGTLAALGLRKIRQSVIHNDTPQIRGMLTKALNLVTFEEFNG